METIDPAMEWKRLQELYSQMSDEELEVVAGEAYDLTDVAREVLQSEIRVRGLKIELEQKSPEPVEETEPEGDAALDPQTMELEVACRVWDENEARIAKRIFDDASIPSYFGPELVERVEDYRGSYAKGAVFKVWIGDQQRASRALATMWPEDPNADTNQQSEVDVEDGPDMRCPKCKSEAVVFESLDNENSNHDDFDAKFNWRCDDCGNTWQDDGIEK